MDWGYFQILGALHLTLLAVASPTVIPARRRRLKAEIQLHLCWYWISGYMISSNLKLLQMNYLQEYNFNVSLSGHSYLSALPWYHSGIIIAPLVLVSKQAGEEKWISVTALQIPALPKEKKKQKGYKVFKIQPRGLYNCNRCPSRTKDLGEKWKYLSI